MSERLILVHTKRALAEYDEGVSKRDEMWAVAHISTAKYKKWVKAEDDAREKVTQAYHKDTGYPIERCRLLGINGIIRRCSK